MLANKLAKFVDKLINSKSETITSESKQSILQIVGYLFENTEITGVKDGIKITFKKKI